MTCPAPWILSMCADDELAAADAAAVAAHAASCARCTAALGALAAERLALRAALDIASGDAPIPAFVPPARRTHWLTLATALAATGTLVETVWSSLGAAVPSALRWLNPLAPGELFERGLRLVTFVVYEGYAMWTSATQLIGGLLFVALLAGLALAATRRRSHATLLASVLLAALALPFASQALEIRKGPLVTLAAGETIDDTLLAAGETVAIDGDVNGDLLAFGRSVTVRGNVAGDLITGAETVDVEGSIGGSIIGGARGLSLLASRVGRNVYGFGRDVQLGADASVAGNAFGFGESVTVDGNVGRDVKGFGSTVTIGGSVGGGVEGYADEVVLLPSARVAGDVTAHVDGAGDLRIAPGASVGGTTREELVEREQRRNRYLTVGYYVRRVIGLGAAFLTGLLLLAAFPVLRELKLPDAMAVLRTGGIGLAAAVTLPVLAVLACITVVGLPLGVLLFVLGAIGLYLATAVVAQIIGRAVLGSAQSPPHYAATLLTGLVIVTVVTSLPFVGSVTAFVVTIVGFGLIVSTIYARLARGGSA